MSRKFGNWTTISCIFGLLGLRMSRNGQNSTSRQIFNPKFEIPMGCFPLEYECKFWWSFCQYLYVFWAKIDFYNAKFSEFGDWWGVGNHFLTKPPKGTYLADFTRVEPLCVQIRSGVFPQAGPRKKGHYKKPQRCYNLPICSEFCTQPKLTKIGVWVGVADLINHAKFGNDRSREYKVTDCRISPCSVGMAVTS